MRVNGEAAVHTILNTEVIQIITQVKLINLPFYFH